MAARRPWPHLGREDILKRQTFIACAAVLLVACGSVCWAAPIAWEDYAPGQLAVAMAPGGPERPDAVAALLRTVRAEVVSVDYLFEAPEKMDSIARGLGLGRFFLVKVDADADHLALRDELSSLPDVESVDLNWVLHPQWTPDDPHFPDQWALQQASDIDMDAPEAWDIARGDSTVVIAIIDSGINYDHEDLEHKIWSNEGEVLDGTDTDGNGYVDDVMGWDFVDTSCPDCTDPDCFDEDNDPMDGFGHGTWVSGIAGAEANNGLGVAGVCPGCRLMPCRVCFDTSGNGACEMYDALAAIYYAVDNGARVINMSFGKTDGDCYYGPDWEAVLGYATAHGVVMVAAAGNYNNDYPVLPACYPTVIGVTTYNSVGDKSGGNYGDWVDVAAPGVSCYTTMLDSTSYGTKSGTSIASPQVAGLAGLLLSARPDLTPDAVRQIVMDSSEDREYWQTVPIAAGRVNAYNALIATGVGESDPTTLGRVAHASFPNPFNPVTTVAYELPRPAHVDLRVYSISGRLVCTLLDSESQQVGSHAEPWRGRDDSGRRVASGAYFYRLNVDGEMHTAKMILVK